MALQDFITNLLPYLLPQPRSRADLEADAARLFNPQYDEMLAETGGDFDRGETRLRENIGFSRADLLRSQTRGLEDLGTEEGLLSRSRALAAEDQARQRAMLTERLATQGLQFGPGLGDIQRLDLDRSQRLQNLDLEDRARHLGTRRSRFGEDITSQIDRLGTDETRGLEDIARERFRGLRGIRRQRAQDIEGYVTNPLYVFPTS